MQTEAISRSKSASLAGIAMPLDVPQKLDTTERRFASNPMVTLLEGAASAARPSSSSTHGLLDAVSALIRAVNCALSGESNHARQYLSAACHSLEPEQILVDAKSIVESGTSLETCRGGLAPWQIRCVSTHI